jgi:hypothetical protein
VNGILTRAPGQSSVRLLLGTHLLLHVQLGIVALASTQAAFMLRSMCGATVAMGILLLIASIHGGPVDDGRRWYQRRRTDAGRGARK